MAVAYRSDRNMALKVLQMDAEGVAADGLSDRERRALLAVLEAGSWVDPDALQAAREVCRRLLQAEP